MFGRDPQKKKEQSHEEQVRELMNRRRITYQEAEGLIKAGQRSIGDF